ncbi:MAG: MarR family transcriptional regulator, partial [Planctomycetota bacterium]
MSRADSPLDRRACTAAAQACACFNLRKASRAVTQLFDDRLRPSGLRSTQFALLAVVGGHEPVPVPRLAEALGV